MSRGSSDLTDDVNEGFSSNLADLVRWAIVAHRKKMGHLIWAGWCPGKKPSMLCKGSHLLMLSKEGMVSLSHGINSGSIERGHIDLVLREWLVLQGVAEDVQCCYIYPSLGGFTQHVSGCDTKRFGAHTAGRPSAFGSGENPANGTRQSSDPKFRGKYLIQWRPKPRDRVWVPCPTDEQLVEPGYKWKSFREPTASETTDPNFVQQEDQATHENVDETQNKRSKRSKRAQRQFEKRDKYRVWADTIEEVGLGSGMVLGSHCKQVTFSSQGVVSAMWIMKSSVSLIGFGLALRILFKWVRNLIGRIERGAYRPRTLCDILGSSAIFVSKGLW